MGSPSDHATEPRCELIIRWKNTDPDLSEYNFNPTTNVSKGIKSIFDKLRMSYSLSSEIEETYFPIDNPNITITAQGIDSYGKTRLLKINYKNSDITLLTSPMQPLNFIETEIWQVTKVNEEILLELQKELNITFESQNVVEDYAKTYNGRLGNVKISIPIEDTIPSSTLSLETGINYVEDTFSELENYNMLKYSEELYRQVQKQNTTWLEPLGDWCVKNTTLQQQELDKGYHPTKAHHNEYAKKIVIPAIKENIK